MQSYRFYFLDKDGAVLGFEEIDCLDDDTAIAKAGGLHPASAPQYTAVEVWQGTRLVHRHEQLTHSNGG